MKGILSNSFVALALLVYCHTLQAYEYRVEDYRVEDNGLVIITRDRAHEIKIINRDPIKGPHSGTFTLRAPKPIYLELYKEGTLLNSFYIADVVYHPNVISKKIRTTEYDLEFFPRMNSFSITSTHDSSITIFDLTTGHEAENRFLIVRVLAIHYWKLVVTFMLVLLAIIFTVYHGLFRK